jgi:hypothetical protein
MRLSSRRVQHGRYAPDLPAAAVNYSAWRGKATAVSQTAPEVFRLGGRFVEVRKRVLTWRVMASPLTHSA